MKIATFIMTLIACGIIAVAITERIEAKSHSLTNTKTNNGVIYRVPTQRKVVAITFDDGPDPLYTPTALDILAKEGIHATFFDVGRATLANPNIVRREVAEGHVVGSHTFSHHPLVNLGAAEVEQEISKGDDALYSAIGKRPQLFRPPYGKWNRIVFDKSAQEKVKIVLWSVCLEHGSLRTPQQLADRVVNLVTPGGIILLHDGRPNLTTDRSTSVAALPIFIKALKKQGYSFVTVPELIGMSTTESKDGGYTKSQKRPSVKSVHPHAS